VERQGRKLGEQDPVGRGQDGRGGAYVSHLTGVSRARSESPMNRGLHPFRKARRQSGVTLVEIMVASTVSFLAMTALVIIFVMARRTLQESFWENILRARTAVFMEQARQLLTFAYAYNAIVATNQPVFNSTSSVTFKTPDSDASGADETYTLFHSGDKVRLTKNGATTDLLDHVSDFHVAQQEGLITLMVTVDATFSEGSRGMVRKQFTMVGRALPRNMGSMAWEAEMN
jgi:Tfp pilus assembly protein PilV